jgi:hypothetical protein
MTFETELKVDTLKKLQLQFKDVITKIKFHDPSHVNSLPIRESNDFTKIKRLEVYQNAYFYRILESLQDDFPETFKSLKDEEAEVRNFLEKFPSRFYNLGEYSQLFPEYFKSTNQSQLFELSLFEWKKVLALTAHDLPPVEMSIFSNYAQEETLELKLKLHPSLQLTTKKDSKLLLYRLDGEVMEDQVDLETYMVVENILNDLNISEIVEKINQPENLFQAFSKLASRGLIVGVIKE